MVETVDWKDQPPQQTKQQQQPQPPSWEEFKRRLEQHKSLENVGQTAAASFLCGTIFGYRRNMQASFVLPAVQRKAFLRGQALRQGVKFAGFTCLFIGMAEVFGAAKDNRVDVGGYTFGGAVAGALYRRSSARTMLRGAFVGSTMGLTVGILTFKLHEYSATLQQEEQRGRGEAAKGTRQGS